MDVHIRATQLPLQTEDIVGVCHQHWTVKPSRTKRLVTPNNERAHSPECQDHGTSERCESSEVTPLTATPYLNYICRPNHRQPPHTGQLVYYCFWGNSLLSVGLINLGRPLVQIGYTSLWSGSEYYCSRVLVNSKRAIIVEMINLCQVNTGICIGHRNDYVSMDTEGHCSQV